MHMRLGTVSIGALLLAACATEMEWTGAEVLTWGQACCYGDGRDGFVSMDAWRWTPRR